MPAILLTILIVGICKNYYNHDLLSMDQVCIISIAFFIATFIVFFEIYVLAYEASESVAERQNAHIDQLSRFIAQHINECFKAHDALTKDVITQQSIKVVETLKKVSEIIVSGDDERAKVLSNLLVDIKQLSITSRDNSFVAKNTSLNCERLANEAIERLDNILICLRGDDVENVEDNEIKVIGE